MRIIVETSRGRSINMLLIVQYELLMHIFTIEIRNSSLATPTQLFALTTAGFIINGHVIFSPNFIMVGQVNLPNITTFITTSCRG